MIGLDDFDSKEFVQLALYAGEHDRHDQALEYLICADRKEPGNPHILLLLSATYAQLRMFDRAISSYSETIRLAPQNYIANLQQAFLYIFTGRAREAVDSLKSLRELSDEDPFFHFAEGLTALLSQDPVKCISSLRNGIGKNRINPSLNEDISRFISALEENQAKNISNHSTQESSSGAFLLSTYKHFK